MHDIARPRTTGIREAERLTHLGFTGGNAREVRQDVATARELSATEIIFMPGYSTGDLHLDTYTATLEQLGSLI